MLEELDQGLKDETRYTIMNLSLFRFFEVWLSNVSLAGSSQSNRVSE